MEHVSVNTVDVVNLKINGIACRAPAGATVLEAAHGAGIAIPTLCYLKELNAIGACRVKVTFAKNGSCTMELEHGSYVVGKIINADYQITARVRVGNAEFAIGECNKAPDPFVTWVRNCKNDGDGPPNYFWGHYRSYRAAAIEDFCKRAGDEYKKQQDHMAQQEHQHTALKKGQGEAR